MNIRDIAGFCPEEAVWKMMTDVSSFLLKERVPYLLTPDTIVVDGNIFIVETGHEVLNEFLAPEYNANNIDMPQMVWALGAVAYYVATGHVFFGGHGGIYQREHPSVYLPVLPKSMQSLNPVVQRCLCYEVEKRIVMEELCELCRSGWNVCVKNQRASSGIIIDEHHKNVEYTGQKWPEEMIEV